MTDEGGAAGSVTLAVLTGPVTGEDAATRRQELAQAITSAPDADLLVLPYLAAQTPFWNRLDRPTAFRQAERPPHPTLQAVNQAARERGIPLLASTYEVLGEGVFYALAEVRGADGELAFAYRQWHALNEPGLHERLYVQPGSGDDAPVFAFGGLRIGLLMGGDLWVPESARMLRLAGAEVIVALTALPESLVEAGAALASARSIENGVPVVLAIRDSAPRLFAVTGEGIMRDEGNGQLIELKPNSIRSRLRRNDPFWMRRPRLYASLVRRWEEQVP